ncbi:MAG: COX15/CtaA family protein [Anaerolineales bacterium]|nr:COX15/CtaA family protein [Anaerolineales bacterium]
MTATKKFTNFAWGVLGFNVLVVLWGAYVRATGSGAGCGAHWPLCNGVVIPRSPQLETVIEFSHRLSSGLAFILVAILFVWAFRLFPRRHPARFGATLSMVFITTEALVGAGLVLFELVAQDTSMERVYSMAVHLINTFLLLAALTLTGWWSTGRPLISFKSRRLTWAFGLALLGVLILGVSGAITALGDTLFPASSLAEGFQQDMNSAAHFTIRVRIWHPIIAVVVGSYLILLSGALALFTNDELKKLRDPEKATNTKEIARLQSIEWFALALIGITVLQLIAGLVNVFLLAPVWMQLVHLFLADSVWIVLIFLTASVLAEKKQVS